jgi:uncharacterized protein YbbC (DUF1343 family)
MAGKLKLKPNFTELKNFTQFWTMTNILLILVFSFFLYIPPSCSQTQHVASPASGVITGADRTEVYLPLLKGKKIGVFANQTSMIGNTHLVDSLLQRGILMKKIFAPEHGFRGKADAGEKVDNSVDKKTGIPITSLYGKNQKPTPADLADIDVLLFDIQDVGVRFYTYISSLQYVLEACLENHKPIMVLDRPNPNGFYVDGPVLDMNFRSFIGMQPVPIVYGMTMGEYAMMIAGEGWLSDAANKINAYNITTEPTVDTPFHFQVIKCKGYDHNTKYRLPVNPSPNLREMQSVYLYPSTGFFEGTVLSEGRGTDKPFQVFGHPSLPSNLYTFIPKPNDGAKTGKCFNQVCYGWNLSASEESILETIGHKIQLKWLLEAYRLFPGKDSFFLKNNFFNKVAGNDILVKQIRQNLPEADIRKSWEPGLKTFSATRKKYLLYKDFDD